MEARFDILTAFGLMLIVVIPVIAMALWFARRYRASNREAVYMPKWCRSAKIESGMWLVPGIIVAAPGSLTGITTHRLDPYKPISPGVEPVQIEAVALDW
jgi:cytochrome o ubiquinol oxidase subunit II